MEAYLKVPFGKKLLSDVKKRILYSLFTHFPLKN